MTGEENDQTSIEQQEYEILLSRAASYDKPAIVTSAHSLSIKSNITQRGKNFFICEKHYAEVKNGSGLHWLVLTAPRV